MLGEHKKAFKSQAGVIYRLFARPANIPSGSITLVNP